MLDRLPVFSFSARAGVGADLLTVAGTQELGSFWERLVQPQVFCIMLVRYGGVSVPIINASRVFDVLAIAYVLLTAGVLIRGV